MVKRFFYLLSLLTVHTSLAAFEKLPSQYQIAYGNPNASIQVTEYFSLNCFKCIESFKKDFPVLKEKYINPKEVYWVFHPHPADLLTLQAIVCLEKLSLEEKRIFLEIVIENLEKPSEGAHIMQVTMETLGKPLPQLTQIDYIKQTTSFQSAYKFLKQVDAVKEIPTVEINGKICDAFPSRKFLEKEFSSLMETRKKS